MEYADTGSPLHVVSSLNLLTSSAYSTCWKIKHRRHASNSYDGVPHIGTDMCKDTETQTVHDRCRQVHTTCRGTDAGCRHTLTYSAVQCHTHMS